MKNKLYIEVCNFCRSTEIEERYLSGPGVLRKPNSMLDKNSSPIIYEVCMSCGSILHSKVKDVNKIK